MPTNLHIKKSNTTLPLIRMIQKAAIWHHYRPKRMRRHGLIKRSDCGLGVTSDKEEISRFYPTLNEQWMIEDTKRIKAPGVTRY